jgi:hypothetical protein
LAVVAAGWVNLHGKPWPYVCTASNFMNDAGEWQEQTGDHMRLRARFLDHSSSHLLREAGQNLTRDESVQVNRLIRRGVERRSASAGVLTRILGGAIQMVANGNDTRNTRVGKGMIIQALSKEALLAGSTMILNRPAPRCHSFVYVSKDGRTNPSEGRHDVRRLAVDRLQSDDPARQRAVAAFTLYCLTRVLAEPRPSRAGHRRAITRPRSARATVPVLTLLLVRLVHSVRGAKRRCSQRAPSATWGVGSVRSCGRHRSSVSCSLPSENHRSSRSSGWLGEGGQRPGPARLERGTVRPDTPGGTAGNGPVGLHLAMRVTISSCEPL